MKTYSLSIFWRDGDHTAETFDCRLEASNRTKVLNSMSFDERPSWELADEDGDVVEEST